MEFFHLLHVFVPRSVVVGIADWFTGPSHPSGLHELLAFADFIWLFVSFFFLTL
jgi:hypothetical protein